MTSKRAFGPTASIALPPSILPLGVGGRRKSSVRPPVVRTITRPFGPERGSAIATRGFVPKEKTKPCAQTTCLLVPQMAQGFFSFIPQCCSTTLASLGNLMGPNGKREDL